MRLPDDILPRGREEGAGGDVASPEPNRGAVFEDQLVAIGLNQSVTARRPLPGVKKGEIHRGAIPAPCVAKPARHVRGTITIRTRKGRSVLLREAGR